MDLTQPEKAEVTYSDITLSLYQTGKYELYLDEPEYEYTIMVEKSHCEKEAKVEFAVVDAHSFGEEYTLLPAANYDLDVNSLDFKGDDVLHTVGLRFHDLTTLDNTKKICARSETEIRKSCRQRREEYYDLLSATKAGWYR